MLLNLLADPFRSVDIGEAALYALLGFLIVFGGISFLIFVVWLVGKVLSKKKTGEKPVKDVIPLKAPEAVVQESDEVDEETIAVIMASIMAYYEQQGSKCDFIVKRIKRIQRF